MHRIKCSLNCLAILLVARLGRTTVEIGKGVRFYQKTRITGKGTVVIGNNTKFGIPAGGRFKSTYCELQARYEDARIKIGENVAINNGLTIISAASVEIGDDTLIGRDLQISDHDGHGIMPHERRGSKGQPKPVSIGRNVWIGNSVTILKGSVISDNCIIGACSVVTGKCFAESTILAGNPAKEIRNLFKTSNQ